jgi:hypothetical protein
MDAERTTGPRPLIPSGPALPHPRGPRSQALIAALLAGKSPSPTPDPVRDALNDEDLHLSLYVCYELHYRGYEGVDDTLEWAPELLRFRRDLEDAFESALSGSSTCRTTRPSTSRPLGCGHVGFHAIPRTPGVARVAGAPPAMGGGGMGSVGGDGAGSGMGPGSVGGCGSGSGGRSVRIAISSLRSVLGVTVGPFRSDREVPLEELAVPVSARRSGGGRRRLGGIVASPPSLLDRVRAPHHHVLPVAFCHVASPPYRSGHPLPAWTASETERSRRGSRAA